MIAAGCGGGGASSAATAPDAPTSAALVITGTTGRLTWTDASTNEAGFEIERNIDGTGWGALLGTAANTNAATVGDLAPETTYSFRIRAVNSAGSSGYTVATGITPPLEQTVFTLTAPYAPNFTGNLDNKLRWPTQNVTYSVDLGAEGRDPAVLKQLVDRAAIRWYTASGGTFTLTRIDDAASANIRIVFVAPSDPAVNSGGEDGNTSYTASPTPPRDTLKSVDLKLKSGIPTALLVPLVTHEFGHAFGIGGHSADPHDTMYPTVSAGSLLTARDVNTLAKIYLTND